MSKLRLSFSLRSLLIVVGIAAVFLGYWRRSQELRNLAAQYHVEAVRNGYVAVRGQKPQSAAWERGWRQTWTWPSPLAMDRTSVSNTVPLWQQSIDNARKSEYCLYASTRPWLFWSSPVAESRLPPLPSDDDDLVLWWATAIGPHVEALGLNQAFGWSSSPDHSHLERDCVFQNGADPDVRTRLWRDIREIMPVEDGVNDEAELPQELNSSQSTGCAVANASYEGFDGAATEEDGVARSEID
jgi:hypothetical protein